MATIAAAHSAAAVAHPNGDQKRSGMEFTQAAFLDATV